MTETSNTDCSRELLQRIAGGSQDALSEFYLSHESQVYAFALSRLNDPHVAADIVNEVMMAVWRGADRFKGGSKVTTWLYSITHHKVIDHLRRSRHSGHEELDPEQADEDDYDAPSEVIARAEDAGQVHQCIQGLSDAHRQVVHLAFFKDLSYGEIADIIDCPEGTVKTRMFHAKKALKKCLSLIVASEDRS